MPGEFEVRIHNDIEFAQHDGTRLIGDLYLPDGLDRAPLVVAVHGGGWQIGTRKFYTHWGDYLARNGFGVFAVDYRLMKPGVKTYPGAVYDVKAAVQFVRAKARELAIDPDRIGLMGDSSGASATRAARCAPAESPMRPMRSGSMASSRALARTNCTAALTSYTAPG